MKRNKPEIGNRDMRGSNIRSLQYRYLLSGLFVLPFTPFLYLQGQYTRLRVGRLPDAVGEPAGVVEGGDRTVRLLAIGESTVAGVGVKDLKQALAARFAEHYSRATGSTVRWRAMGVSGITVRRALKEIVPELPDDEFDIVVVALGGNDVFALNSPVGFRKDMTELITSLRAKSPEAAIFLANVPMIRDALALPHPLKYVLAKLAKMQHFNVIDLVSLLDDVYYFDDVKRVKEEFFSDGVHPSEFGYDIWASEMVECYLKKSGGASG